MNKDPEIVDDSNDQENEYSHSSIELVDFSSKELLSLNRQEFYCPYVPPSLVLTHDSEDRNNGFNKSNMLSQNFMGICYDEIFNCIRDRYGFDIQSDYYYIKEYLQFAEQYEQTTIQQTITWEKLLTPCYPDLPLPSLSVRDAARNGIPTSLRGKCWYYYSGAYHHYCNDPTLYSHLMSELSKCHHDNLDVIDKGIISP